MKIIAYYLPQYHPIEENDEWWGKGFTEWTNVGKAQPLYRGHYQPKVPADLGYYDLRLPQVLESQQKLALEAGITGFCYWHYWFGGGKKLLEKPLEELIYRGGGNFPICLGWANESWKAKVWSNSSTGKDRVLIEQTYPEGDDVTSHFEYVFQAIKETKYITHNGRPVFIIYKPLLLKNAKNFIKKWNELLSKKGFSSKFYFIGHAIDASETKSILELGFDAVNIVRIGEHRYNKAVIRRIFLKLISFKIIKGPLRIKYKFISRYFIGKEELSEDVIPTLIPNWDHTPRSGRNGVVFDDASPDLFYKHALHTIEMVKHKKNKIKFLKSWNEWGEGNYMEPDLRYGQKYIKALRRALFNNGF